MCFILFLWLQGSSAGRKGRDGEEAIGIGGWETEEPLPPSLRTLLARGKIEKWQISSGDNAQEVRLGLPLPIPLQVLQLSLPLTSAGLLPVCTPAACGAGHSTEG